MDRGKFSSGSGFGERVSVASAPFMRGRRSLSCVSASKVCGGCGSVTLGVLVQLAGCACLTHQGGSRLLFS